MRACVFTVAPTYMSERMPAPRRTNYKVQSRCGSIQNANVLTDVRGPYPIEVNYHMFAYTPRKLTSDKHARAPQAHKCTNYEACVCATTGAQTYQLQARNRTYYRRASAPTTGAHAHQMHTRRASAPNTHYRRAHAPNTYASAVTTMTKTTTNNNDN